MDRRICSLCILAFGLAALSLLAGCAATKPADLPGDPKLIRDELSEIQNEIANTEEMIKGNRAQLQVDDSQDLRNEITTLEAQLGQLKSRRTALEQRLRELGAAGKQ
jgi:septal ring factor EnvC (AmiA/AmiB activator)